MTDALETLLHRSAELHRALDDQLSRARFDDSIHTDLTLVPARLALEHGSGIAILVESGRLSSAGVLLRAQLEATIRAAWLLYVASDEWIEKYLEKARDNPHRDPGSTPAVDEMIKAIERKAAEGLAPSALAPQLRVLKEGAWHSLNSFVHSGLHPTLLQFSGYSAEAADAALRNANSLSVVAAMLIALLSGDEEVAESVKNLQPTFFDCCTPATPA